MKIKRYIVSTIIVVSLLSPLYSAPLESIIRDAKLQSTTIQRIEISKKNSDLAIALSETDEKFGISVGGDVFYGKVKMEGGEPIERLNVSPTVTLTFPNEGKSTITISPDFSFQPNKQDKWDATPSVSVKHTFTFGDTQDIIDDLSVAKDKLEVEQRYQQQLYDFESSIYGKIVELLTNEKSLLTNEKDLLTQQTKIENALKLKTVSEGSVAYQSLQLELARLENAKEATLQKMAMLKRQYYQLTGLEWEGVEEIREAKLSFTPLLTGDTSVILASLDLEIAKENLALLKRTITPTQISQLSVTGGGGFTYKPNENTSYNANASLNYAAKNFNIGGGVTLGISGSGTLTPTYRVSGNWSNNPTSTSELLKLSSSENSLTIATMNYHEALFEYQSRVNQLEIDLLSYQQELKRFDEIVTYREDSLAKTLLSFEKGLVTQTDVDLATYEVELSRYEKKIYALNGLVLENRVKALQL